MHRMSSSISSAQQTNSVLDNIQSGSDGWTNESVVVVGEDIEETDNLMLLLWGGETTYTDGWMDDDDELKIQLRCPIRSL